MALSINELLKPRYRVIALYPCCKHKIGDILVRGDVIPYFINIRDSEIITDAPQNYPSVFMQLFWWQERKLNELPEYVRMNERVFKIDYWIKSLGGFTPRSIQHPKEYPESAWHFWANESLPVTEAEYITYKQKS